MAAVPHSYGVGTYGVCVYSTLFRQLRDRTIRAIRLIPARRF